MVYLAISSPQDLYTEQMAHSYVIGNGILREPHCWCQLSRPVLYGQVPVELANSYTYNKVKDKDKGTCQKKAKFDSVQHCISYLLLHSLGALLMILLQVGYILGDLHCYLMHCLQRRDFDAANLLFHHTLWTMYIKKRSRFEQYCSHPRDQCIYTIIQTYVNRSVGHGSQHCWT